MLQLVDSNKNRSMSSSGVGIINYTNADLEECASYTASAIIAGSYSEFVSHLSGSRFGSIDVFNSYIEKSVDEAGYATPAGVVAAALALSCGYSKETGYKLFYQHPGTTEKMDGVQSDIYLDCRAFVWCAMK